VLASVADIAIVPLEDVLGLGSEARMNLPGKMSGNWRWQYLPAALSGNLSVRLRELVALYDR
jgi:4-alpha-glucanotransferase